MATSWGKLASRSIMMDSVEQRPHHRQNESREL
jgi:hypothetical protein